MLVADLHTHTQYSHGVGTPEDVVRAAIRKGLKRIAITEHGPKHLFFPVKLDALLRLRRDIDRLQDVYGDQIQIQMGLEANLLGYGVTDVPADDTMFDFVLLGYHKGTMPVDARGKAWLISFFGRQSRKKHAQVNTEAYIRAMDNTKKLLAISHPDTYIPIDPGFLAREATARGILLELNEAHKNFTLAQLTEAHAAGGRFLISSDAHKPERVGVCEHSLALAHKAGCLGQVVNYVEEG